MRGLSAPHHVPAAVLVTLLAGAYAVARLPLAGPHGPGAALLLAVSLTCATALLLALTARLAAASVGDRALAACGAAAALLAWTIRHRGVQGPAFELGFDVALVVAAAAVGRLFVNQVLEAWWIVPLGLTGACADFISVFMPGAPTYEMVESGSPVLEYLLLVWPNFRAGPAPGFVGVSDFVIAAILYAHGARFSFDGWRTFRLLWAALVACLVLAGAWGLGLPAIPFLFVFYVGGHRKALYESFKARPVSPRAPGS